MSRYIPVEPEKWGEMVKAMAEVKRLQAEVERLSQPKNSKDALEFIHTLDYLAIKKQKEEIERLKAEVEHLTSENLLVREESDRHYQLWVDSQAEVERLKNNVAYLDQKLDEELGK